MIYTSNTFSSLLLALLLFSCSGEQVEKVVITDSAQTEKPLITFAVAGHVYGNSDHYTHSIYPPFLKRLKADHQKHDFDFLFLTGDVVHDTSEATWNYVKAQLDSLDLLWLIAPGNHDPGCGSILVSDQLTGEDEYADGLKTIRDGSNAYFILDTSNPGWTIGTKEAAALSVMLYEADTLKNIFFFTHQLWWLRNTPPEFELDSIRPNSFALYDGPSDFWQDVFPYFDSTGIETWFFAGDVGADEKLESYYEDYHGRFHFYASGMGGGKADNYLIVRVYQNGRVDIERIGF